MVGYIEKLINFRSSMMALAAKDASFTSAPTLQGPSLTSNNIVVQELSKSLHPNSIFQLPPTNSTLCPAFCVENPAIINSDAHHHHDGCWPTDLTVLQAKITQTFNNFSAFLTTLKIPPRQTAPVQPMLAMTSVKNDNYVHHPIGCQKLANNNNASLMHHTQCPPMDLLALQWDIQQFTDNMQAFFD